jgi:glycogen debranching enzyme
MAGELVSILEGDTYVVSDRRGDVDSSPDEPHGLFSRDTRYLSRWRLTVDGRRALELSYDRSLVELAALRFLPTFDARPGPLKVDGSDGAPAQAILLG